MIAPSQGVHVVLDRSFIPGDSAIMVPSTDDGRVMFAIPWHDVAVVGTTDTPIDRIDLEPQPMRQEVEFILETTSRYLARPPRASDVKSVFAGIRPLVKTGNGSNTAALSRDHTILIDPDSGLMTVAGGKWTTYRRMAQDVVDQATVLGALEARECVTRHFSIHGFHRYPSRFGALAFYGSDAQLIEKLQEEDESMAAPLHPKLPITGAEVQWVCRNEMARTVDDVLARRTRCLLFDARAAIEVATPVAEIMAAELGRDRSWVERQIADFEAIAAIYVFEA
jgi:glycerol-3-phosphate dehydrogenase